MDDALKAKKKLDSVSDTFCLAKWYQTSLHLTTGHTNSCYHCPQHKIDDTRIQDFPDMLHNTKQKRDQRFQMLNGDRPPECSYCWNIEDQGRLSDRHYRSGEPWAFNDTHDAEKNVHVDPSYVEVNFNSACNLKCMYCSPQYSSTWMAHAKEHGAYPTLEPHNDPEYFTGDRKPIPQRDENPYLDAFWKWFPNLYPTLKHFRMTGGEPLMDKNTYKVFDHILANPKPDLHLNITSNFSVEPDLFNKYIEYSKRICDGENVEHMMTFVSLDGFGAQAEYMRSGLDFNRLWDNVNRYLTDVPGRNSVTFIITMNALSIASLRDLFSAIYGLRQIYSKDYQRVWFDVPLLRDPAWMSIQNLPPSYQYELSKIIKYISGDPDESCSEMNGFRDYEVQKLERDLDYMKIELPEQTLLKNKVNFHRFFTEYDKRNGTDFKETFPEMEEYWSECEYRSKNYD